MKEQQMMLHMDDAETPKSELKGKPSKQEARRRWQRKYWFACSSFLLVSEVRF
jgi:hypothetical protein